MMDRAAFEATFDLDTKVYRVYMVLCDGQWHCRGCEYGHVESTQIAGGSGIQGLQRGTNSRPGMVIDSGNHLCVSCDSKTRHDRWAGSFTSAIPSPSMSPSFAMRAVGVLGGRDVVEQTERPPTQLTVDHKVPMLRWDAAEQAEQSAYPSMSDDDIRAKFQLLKKSNGSVSHNQLKSRACERCYQHGQRGTPFGIVYFYAGGPRWEPADRQDPSGCIGCGWYDFARWRQSLNQTLRREPSS